MVDIAHQRRRFAYRWVRGLLRQDFPGVNNKRTCRLYTQANPAVRKQKGQRPIQERVPLQLVRSVNKVRNMDFVPDSLSNGRRLKLLAATDDFSHKCVDIAVDCGISGKYVLRLLNRAAVFRAAPRPCVPTTARSSPERCSRRGLYSMAFDTS